MEQYGTKPSEERKTPVVKKGSDHLKLLNLKQPLPERIAGCIDRAGTLLVQACSSLFKAAQGLFKAVQGVFIPVLPVHRCTGVPLWRCTGVTVLPVRIGVPVYHELLPLPIAIN